MILSLPYPPSNNRYYRHYGSRVVISKEGRNYRWEILSRRPAAGWPVPGPLKLVICVFPPTRWGMDLDNIPKALCDALTSTRIISDDREVAELLVLRGPKKPNPSLFVLIETLRTPEFW